MYNRIRTVLCKKKSSEGRLQAKKGLDVTEQKLHELDGVLLSTEDPHFILPTASFQESRQIMRFKLANFKCRIRSYVAVEP